MKELVFDEYGLYAVTTTASGKRAVVCRNETNIRKVLYSLVVDGKTVFSRGTIETVFRKLAEL